MPKNSVPLASFFLALLALAIWLITRSYYGIWHDEVFYSLIALDYLQPDLYRNDLFFLYGSQSTYTLFTPFLAEWIKLFGLDSGLLWATVTGQALWIAALLALTTAMLPRRLWALALLAVALFPPYYTQLTSYGEPFVTPRLYSEAFALFGLAALLRGRAKLAAVSLLLSLAIHPLMGLAAIGLALLYKIKNPRLWLLLILASGVATLLGAIFKLGPFATMGQILTPLLVTFERHHSPWLFLDQWPWENISIALYTLIILSLAIRWLDKPLAALAKAALIIALLGLGLAALADLSHYDLLLGLQTARALWLTQLLAILLWFPVAAHYWQHGKSGRYSAVLLASAALGAPFAMTPIALLAVAYWWGSQKWQVLREPDRLIQAVIWLFPVQILLWALLNAELTYQVRGLFELRPIWLVLAGKLLPLAVAAGLLGWLYQPRARRHLQRLVAVTALITLGVAVGHWDMRAYTRPANTSARQQIMLPLQQLIPPGAVVYWANGVHQAWFWLHRADYISTQQLAGTIFTPQTAIEGMRRMKIMDAAGFPDNSWDFDKASDPSRDFNIHSLTAVRQICADPVIHSIILKTAVPGLTSEYHFIDPTSGEAYFAYACQPLRSNPTVLK